MSNLVKLYTPDIIHTSENMFWHGSIVTCWPGHTPFFWSLFAIAANHHQCTVTSWIPFVYFRVSIRGRAALRHGFVQWPHVIFFASTLASSFLACWLIHRIHLSYSIYLIYTYLTSKKSCIAAAIVYWRSSVHDARALARALDSCCGEHSVRSSLALT